MTFRTSRPSSPSARRLLGAAALLLLAACGGGEDGGDGGGGLTGTGAAVAEITLSPGSTTLGVGQRATFTAELRDSSGAVLSARTLEWRSSNTSVATVANGVVTGVGAGSATVSARSGSVQGTAFFTVIGTPTGDVVVSAPADSVMTGATLQLAAVARDAQGSPIAGARVTWASTDTLVAQVSSTGLVTGRLSGTAVIRATSGATAGHYVIRVRESQPIVDVRNSLALRQSGACALTPSGEAWCWGRTPFYDDIPLSRIDSADGPGCFDCVYSLRAPGGHRFTQVVAVAPLITMGLTQDGQVYVWGRTETTAHWRGSEAYRPTLVPTSARFTKLAAGDQTVFGITAAGEAYGWGGNPLTYGRTDQTPSATPVAFGGALRFRDVAVTGAGVALVTTGGDVYLSPTTAAETRPLRVPTTRPYARVFPGGGQGAGSFFHAATAAGEVYAVSPYTEALFEARSGGPQTYVQVVPGSAFGPSGERLEEDVVGLTPDGRLFTWGMPCLFCQPGQPAPLRELWPGRRWQAVATALYGTIAMADNDTVYAWGRNDNARLGLVEVGSAFGTPTMGIDGAFRPFVSTASASVPQGGRTSHTVRFQEIAGSMTRHGPRRWTRPRTVQFQVAGNAAGVTGTVFPSTILGDGAMVGVSITTSPSAGTGTYSTFVDVQPGSPLLGSSVAGTSMQLTITPPPPPPGTPLDLRCATGSTVLPAGFQCLTNPSGAHVPGKFAGDASFNSALHGTWVDSGAGICINWQANGQATVRYSPDGFGGNGQASQSGPAEWGVIVKRDGTPEGTATQWYVYTDAADDQTKVLGIDTGAAGGAQIIGYQFRRQSCPW